jgi:hypothetical protein
VKDSFYEELKCVFDKFATYHMKMLLRRVQWKSRQEKHFETNNWELKFTQN